MAAFRRFIDIGANLTDDMFAGIYRGSQKHPRDITQMLTRCWKGKIAIIWCTYYING